MTGRQDYPEDGWASPPEQSGHLANTLVGELVALRPTEFDKPMETSIGVNEATWCDAIVVGDGGQYRNLGTMPIFWEVVRRQLHQAKPWLAGRVGERGRAFVIDPPEGDEAERITLAIKRFLAK